MNFLNVMYHYRGFIVGNIKREFQSKYQNSILGAAWTVINPLAMILVYTVIFSQIMRAKLPGIDHSFGYSIYLCAGVLSWGLFSEIAGRSQNIFLENANILKKINFPRICLPITLVCNALLNFSIIFGLFTLFLMVMGLFPGLVYFSIIPVLFILVLFAVGLGMTIGILNVFFRDVGQLFGIVLQFWFWMTPIVYPVSILPKAIVPLMNLNPMSGVVSALQNILVNGAWPDWYKLLPALVLGLLFGILSLSLFRKHAGEIVDEL